MASSTMKTTKQPLTFTPMTVASQAGAAGSGWMHLGDAPWVGHVTKKDGTVLDVEEVAAGWKVTDESGKTVGTGRELLTVLKKVLP